jgi:exopolysaccharide biosynthesis polyprenyl glycosylphosphotransferase
VLEDGTHRIAAVAGVQRPSPFAVSGFLLPTPFAGDDPGKLWPSLLADYACVLAAWLTIAVLRSLVMMEGLSALHANVILSTGQECLGTGLLFAVIVTLLGYSEGLYRVRSGRASIAILAKSVGWTTVVVGASVRLAGSAEPSIPCLTGSSLLAFAALISRRYWNESESESQKRSRNVLVGTGPFAREVAAHIERHPELGRAVRGFLDEESILTRGATGIDQRLATMARTEFVDEVILAAPLRRDVAQTVIREARRNHLDVKVIPDLHGYAICDQRVEHLGIAPLVTLHEERLPTAGLFIKRVLDVTVSAWALLLFGPMMLLIGCLIRVDSPGPAVYSALRVGRKGKRFRCHKFRTMVANAGEIKEQLREHNQREGPTFKMAADPRITRMGAWLRRYSLDELPQLWNVFQGEMSLVGPRPHPLDDFARYELEHLRRLDVTPGITGLWQVTARRVASFHTNMALDLEYIERWNVWMDLRILLRTVAVVLQGTGA